MGWRGFLLLAGLIFAPALPAGADPFVPPEARAETFGDADRGAGFWTQCKGCHEIGAGARIRIGPPLTGLFGRRAGAVEGFAYSKSMARMGADGLTWNWVTLDAYVENPKALVSGTRMAYRGLKDPQDRADLIAFLRSHSDRPQDIPEAAPTARRLELDLPADVLALQGDPAWGEYLAAECQTCHRRDGSDQGIPSITQWPVEDFVIAMHAYKRKLRPHPVMQMMAGRLSDEEIAALAAYFATLGE